MEHISHFESGYASFSKNRKGRKGALGNGA
jgi:hypothetical protein